MRRPDKNDGDTEVFGALGEAENLTSQNAQIESDQDELVYSDALILSINHSAVAVALDMPSEFARWARPPLTQYTLFFSFFFFWWRVYDPGRLTTTLRRVPAPA
jgi:hypothetical protein